MNVLLQYRVFLDKLKKSFLLLLLFLSVRSGNSGTVSLTSSPRVTLLPTPSSLDVNIDGGEALVGRSSPRGRPGVVLSESPYNHIPSDEHS